MEWKAIAMTDLDGTLLNDEKQVSAQDIATLHLLARQKIVRVAATGRPLKQVHEVIPFDFPLDYVIFSSGAGVIRWHDQQILYKRVLSQEQIRHLYELFMAHELSFAVQKPIPDNHYFYYKLNRITTWDFQKRCERFAHYAEPLPENVAQLEAASQFLVTFPNLQEFNHIAGQIRDLQVIRATSPVDFNTIWMEIFPEDVSKGHTAEWLTKHLQVNPRATFAVGNDYNDLHLLQWAEDSYVVENAPHELKAMFYGSASNQESGFTKAVNHFLNKNGHSQ